MDKDTMIKRMFWVVMGACIALGVVAGFLIGNYIWSDYATTLELVIGIVIALIGGSLETAFWIFRSKYRKMNQPAEPKTESAAQ